MQSSMSDSSSSSGVQVVPASEGSVPLNLGEDADSQVQAAKRGRIISLVIGFSLLIGSSVLAIVFEESPWFSLIGTVGLVFHVASNKLGHLSARMRRKSLAHENKNIKNLVQSQNLKSTPKHPEKVSKIAKKLHDRLVLGEKQLKMIYYSLQILGFIAIVSSAVIAFFPQIQVLTPISMQSGWMIFVAGSLVEDYRQQLDGDNKQKENIALKTHYNLTES